MQRQISIYIEELENFSQIRVGNAGDLEQFFDLLDIAMINLKESNQDQELGNGTLYTILQRKLPQSMLANYHRWVYDNNVTQSVATLRQWVILESEFQTVASETVHGVTGKMSDAHHQGKDKEIQELSSEIAGIIAPRRRSAVRLVEQIITFGHVRYLNRRVFLISGTSLNVVNFVSAVWRKDIPV